MLVKVCGLNNAENADQIAQLGVDFTGHIYHTQSPRHYSGNTPLHKHNNIKRVGVFVNQPLQLIKEKITEWQLNVVQLHGTETPEFTQAVHQLGVDVWKVIHINFNTINWNDFAAYLPYITMFLFDYKSDAMGGAGKKFNWDLLDAYDLDKPVMLAGGITPNDAAEIKKAFKKHSFLKGVDLNSRFESQAGIKNIELLQQFLHKLK